VTKTDDLQHEVSEIASELKTEIEATQLDSDHTQQALRLLERLVSVASHADHSSPPRPSLPGQFVGTLINDEDELFWPAVDG
jgi:hypothetical protein